MCSFCKSEEILNTAIDNHNLTLSIKKGKPELLKVKIETNKLVMYPKPICIKFCPLCGDNLTN
jgi:hypothetical protein